MLIVVTKSRWRGHSATSRFVCEPMASESWCRRRWHEPLRCESPYRGVEGAAIAPPAEPVREQMAGNHGADESPCHWPVSKECESSYQGVEGAAIAPPAGLCASRWRALVVPTDRSAADMSRWGASHRTEELMRGQSATSRVVCEPIGEQITRC